MCPQMALFHFFWGRSNSPLCLYSKLLYPCLSWWIFWWFSVLASVNCARQECGVCIFMHWVFVLLLARGAVARLSGDSIFLFLRNLCPVLLMPVSSVHSHAASVGGACLSRSSQHQSCVIIRWWPSCWLPGDPSLVLLILQFSVRSDTCVFWWDSFYV